MGSVSSYNIWDKVEKTDTCWNWTGAKGPHGHGYFHHEGKRKAPYRVAFEELVGEIPKGYSIDHLCHNPACVRPDHLRAATHQQNMANRKGAHKNSKSGIRGVFWKKSKQKWHVQIKVNGRDIHIGYFTSIDDAEKASIAARRKYFGLTEETSLGNP